MVNDEKSSGNNNSASDGTQQNNINNHSDACVCLSNEAEAKQAEAK